MEFNINILSPQLINSKKDSILFQERLEKFLALRLKISIQRLRKLLQYWDKHNIELK